MFRVLSTKGMKEHNPYVSVCMVTYNQEAYISAAIESVLMQKDCEYELIIADDCSTDGTLAICQKYQERYPDIIKLIRQSGNKGVVGNTKDCMIACKGKYIAVCEGDDYWIDDHKLQKQVTILEQDPTVSMVHTNWENFFQEKNQFEEHKPVTGDFVCEKQAGKNGVLEIIQEQYRGIRFSSICFRAETLRKAMSDKYDLFNIKYPTCDIVLFYMLAYHGRIAYLPEKTTVYRIQRESVSISSNSKKNIKFTIGCIYIYYDTWCQYDLPRQLLNKKLKNSFHYLLETIHESGDTELLKEALALTKEIGYKPSLLQMLRIPLCYVTHIAKTLFGHDRGTRCLCTIV